MLLDFMQIIHSLDKKQCLQERSLKKKVPKGNQRGPEEIQNSDFWTFKNIPLYWITWVECHLIFSLNGDKTNEIYELANRWWANISMIKEGLQRCIWNNNSFLYSLHKGTGSKRRPKSNHFSEKSPDETFPGKRDLIEDTEGHQNTLHDNQNTTSGNDRGICVLFSSTLQFPCIHFLWHLISTNLKFSNVNNNLK